MNWLILIWRTFYLIKWCHTPKFRVLSDSSKIRGVPKILTLSIGKPRPRAVHSRQKFSKKFIHILAFATTKENHKIVISRQIFVEKSIFREIAQNSDREQSVCYNGLSEITSTGSWERLEHLWGRN